MGKVFREFQIFAKPVGAACNLRCKYCYYLEKSVLYHGHQSPLMSDAILEKYIIQHIEATTEETVFFSWHGGEPMLSGLETFKNIVTLQRKHNKEGRKILNGIQTNGTLINRDWASFLSSEGFLVGLSIDGPGDLHNIYRTSANRKPTLDFAIKGFRILREFGIQCELLCVVHSGNVKYPHVVYDFFRGLGASYITFLPLVERIIGGETAVTDRSVLPNEFGSFLCTIFDEWIEKDIGKIKIQIFEEAVRPAFGQEHTLCIFREKCGGVPVIEHNGDFYSCDHFVNSDNLIGNINNGTIAGFLDSEKQKKFGERKLLTLPVYCKKCEVRSMCNGECPKNRFTHAPDGEPGLNYLCSGYKTFFNHCKPFVDAIGEEWRKKNNNN